MPNINRDAPELVQKQNAAREVVDVLLEISTLLVSRFSLLPSILWLFHKCSSALAVEED